MTGGKITISSWSDLERRQKFKGFCGVDFQKTDIELFQTRFSSMAKNRRKEDNESIFVGLEYTEAPERIEPISVASEQVLDVSVKANIQHAATKDTDIGSILSGASSVIIDFSTKTDSFSSWIRLL